MVRTEVTEGAYLWITLDDPAALNAMDPEAMATLAAAWARFRDEDDLLVAIVTGAGDRAFTVGSNLKTFVPKLHSGELDPRDNQEAYMKGELGPVFKPVIAAVNGDCLGGGVELLTCTDIRLAVPAARFGLPECRWGVFPGGGGVVRLQRQIGYAHAMDLLLTGRMASAAEAKEMGLPWTRPTAWSPTSARRSSTTPRRPRACGPSWSAASPASGDERALGRGPRRTGRKVP